MYNIMCPQCGKLMTAYRRKVPERRLVSKKDIFLCPTCKAYFKLLLEPLSFYRDVQTYTPNKEVNIDEISNQPGSSKANSKTLG